MKPLQALFCADLHISEKISLLGRNTRGVDGERRSLADARRVLTRIHTIAVDNEVDVVVVVGDIFDRGRPTPAEYQVVLDWLTSCAGFFEVILVIGNHDQSSGVSSDALAPLEAAKIEGVYVEREATSYSYESVYEDSVSCLFSFLPYPSDKSQPGAEEDWATQESDRLSAQVEELALNSTRADGASILFAHHTFSGSDYGAERLVQPHDVQVTTQHNHAFDLVVAGHLHKAQAIPNGCYLGSTDCSGFLDEGHIPRVMLATIHQDSIDWGFVEDYEARRFISYDYTSTPVEVFDDIEPRDYIRFVGQVTEASALEEAQGWARELIRRGAGGARSDVKLVRHGEELPAVEERATLEDLFDAYNFARPDSIPEDVRPDVLALIKELIQDIA